jgi:outer membrane lipoprotein SlyB
MIRIGTAARGCCEGKAHIWQKLLLACLTLFTVAGCTSTFPAREINYKPTDVVRPEAEIAESELLGIRINPFDAKKPAESKSEGSGVSADIRKAEGYFVAVKLKKTMEGTGHWGPVRVVPQNSRDGEVIVSGTILESDGEILSLEVRVRDAMGAAWFTKEYGGVVSKAIYEQTRQVNVDAYQYLYNQIANDIALYRQKITKHQITRIRQVAELRFAADFAPDAFSGHLAEKAPEKSQTSDMLSSLLTFVGSNSDPEPAKNTHDIVRLPSADDPIFQRILRIRGREHLLIDTLDQQYEAFAQRISDAYTQWRMARLDEMNAIREREKLRDEKVGQAIAIGLVGALAGAAVGSQRNCYSCAAAGGAIAGAAINIAFQQSVQASEQAEADTKIRKAALEELGQSLSAEVKPVVMEVEGETVELTGTVEAKFQQWRGLMKTLYEREVGPINDSPPPSLPSPLPAASDTEPPKTS